MGDYFKSIVLTNRQAGVRREDGTVEYDEQDIHIPSQFEYDLLEVIPFIVKAIGVGVLCSYIAWLIIQVGQ